VRTIQPFIDAGFHTVPLKGSLKRLPSGKKTTPLFERDWKSTYSRERNQTPSSLGGLLTGPLGPHDIIAIDCDDAPTWALFRSLDPAYTFTFISKGKAGGTLIYSRPKNMLESSFSLQTEQLHLDFFSTGGFVYVPTDANSTKEGWSETLPPLTPPPPTTITVLQNLHTQYSLARGGVQKDSSHHRASFHLAPLLGILAQQKKVVPKIFKILTPKDFRTCEDYITKGYLAPNDVPEGRGSEYLSKLSAILGADGSVAEDLYAEIMHLVNSMWDTPMDEDRLDSTIINPMLEGTARINGEKLWHYDPNWESTGLRIFSKRGEVLDCFYDEVKRSYFLHNQLTTQVTRFVKEADLFSHLEVISTVLAKRPAIKTMMPLIRTYIRPELSSGFFEREEERSFNLFKQSMALSIVNAPEAYAPLYSRPSHILNYLDTLIPDARLRSYILRFLKTKLTTFAYSPVIFYLLGISGSGKDTFVNLLANILGLDNDYIAKPSASEFLEKHNGWLVDKYFVQLDEYGDQLQVFSQKQEALGRIKAYTGKDIIQIRQMRRDGYNMKHSITFMLTANSNPLIVDENDRRILLIDTPNVLREADWVQAAGGMSLVIDKLQIEVKDFCYYLATEVETLTMDEYGTPPQTPGKQKLIAKMLQPTDKIIFALKYKLEGVMKELIDFANYNPFDMLDGTSENKLYELLVRAYPDKTISRRSLATAVKKYGVTKIPTTRQGVKDYKLLLTPPSSVMQGVFKPIEE